MDINTLHEHNREAYQKVMQHFNEGHQKACVVHATGTGKSMIITAVSDHFERVLILTTNMFTIEQVGDTFKKYSPGRTVEPTFMIYQALLQQMRDEVDYSHAFDLIVFDEFHHGGAEEWGKAVNWIIEQNPSAKVLGTSATAIRHSDGGRDMGDELFDGNVVSTLSLGEAWARKVLMAPYYIMAVEDSEEFYNDFIRKIEESNLLEDKKAHYREMAKNVKDNYEMEKNAPEIIRKWLPADTRRVIVFSKDIQEAESNLAKVKKWMKKAGFTIAGIYMIHSKRPFEEKKRQMKLFQDDDFAGVKVMVAVDMLNEGIHVPDVDSVFFLRKTQSPTIHLQQMGRCMYRYKENGKRPVVFDFRNNVENTRRAEHTGSFFSDAAKDYDAWKDLEDENQTTQVIREQNKTERVRENFPDGINYTMDYGIMIDRFNTDVVYQNEWGLLEYYAGIAEEYYKQHKKKIPSIREYESAYSCLKRFWKDYKRRAEKPEIVEILKRSGFEDKVKEDLLIKYALQAEEYYKQHGKRIPCSGENVNIYRFLNRFWRDEKGRVKRPEVVEILHRSGFGEKKEDLLMKYALIADKYYKQHGKKIPSNGDYVKSYSMLKNFWRDGKGRAKRPEVVEILKRSGLEDKVKEDLLIKYALQAEEYYIKHGKRIPCSRKYANIYQFLNVFWRDEKRRVKRPEVVEILHRSGFGEKKEDLLMKYALIAEIYFIQNGTKMTTKGIYYNAYSRLMDFWRNKKKRAERPDIVKILLKSGFKN